MADPRYLPPEPVLSELPGGRTRPSVLVDVSELPAVARRRELNEQLLAGTCAFSEGNEWLIDRENLDLLLLVIQERFEGDRALLRREAVSALGTIDADEAVRRLMDLAVAPVEHDQIRITALAALPEDLTREIAGQLVDDPSPAVREYAGVVVSGERPERRKVPGQVPLDPEKGPGEPPDRHCAPCC